jgi:hypothetical protein
VHQQCEALVRLPDKRHGKVTDTRMPLVARPLSSMAVEKGAGKDTLTNVGAGILSNAISEKKVDSSMP